MFEELHNSDGFRALQQVSSRLGNDPLQVQGPGGNSSIKRDGAMWIKASGTWLAEAETRDIMVPCDAGVLQRALAEGAVDQPGASTFVPAGMNPHGLRPSIETAVHAALDWPVVLHTHCVATIALAIRSDGAERIAALLPDLSPVIAPYVKPGWDLARTIRTSVVPETQVVVLGNHGLVVCGETAEAAEALLRSVSARLTPDNLLPALAPHADLTARLAGTDWVAAPDDITHAVARDPARLAKAEGATLYPDHLIFLGPGCISVASEAGLPALGDLAPARKIMLLLGLGAAVPADASPAVLAMARCLGDVLARVPEDAVLQRLTAMEEADLLDWDAEKYRQSLNKQTGA